MPGLEDFGAEALEHVGRLRAWISVDLKALEPGMFQESWNKLLNRRSLEVRHQRISILVGFGETGAPAIAAQIPIVAEGAGFVLAGCDHLLRNSLEGAELLLVDREFNYQVYGLRGHGFPLPICQDSNARAWRKHGNLGSPSTPRRLPP